MDTGSPEIVRRVVISQAIPTGKRNIGRKKGTVETATRTLKGFGEKNL